MAPIVVNDGGRTFAALSLPDKKGDAISRDRISHDWGIENYFPFLLVILST